MEVRGQLLLCAFGIGTVLLLPIAGFARQQQDTRAALGPVVGGDETHHALIYVYRNAGWAGRALKPRVLLDDVELVTMDNKRYFSLWVEPGQHSLSAGGGMTRACQARDGLGRALTSDTFESGMVYFVEIRLFSDSSGGCFFPLPIPNHAFGKGEISKLKPLDRENVRHPAVRLQ
jgi:hypothetical protein